MDREKERELETQRQRQRQKEKAIQTDKQTIKPTQRTAPVVPHHTINTNDPTAALRMCRESESVTT